MGVIVGVSVGVFVGVEVGIGEGRVAATDVFERPTDAAVVGSIGSEGVFMNNEVI